MASFNKLPQSGRKIKDSGFLIQPRKRFRVHSTKMTDLFLFFFFLKAVYNLLLFSQRRKLHRSVAKYYEKNNIHVFTLLAHHWLQSLEKGVRKYGLPSFSSKLNCMFFFFLSQKGLVDEDYIMGLRKVGEYAVKIGKQTKKATATHESKVLFNKLSAILSSVKDPDGQYKVNSLRGSLLSY